MKKKIEEVVETPKEVIPQKPPISALSVTFNREDLDAVVKKINEIIARL